VQAGFSPGRVDLVQLARGWRPRVTAKLSLTCHPEPEQSAWHASLAGLKQGLAELRVRGAVCSVVVDNGLARYLLAPWRDELADARERARYIELQLQDVYGSAAKHWEIAMSEAGYGMPTLVCALDREMIAGIRRTVREAGLRLESIQPYLGVACNRWRGELKGSDIWFALLEPQRICLARIVNGVLSLLRSQRIGDRADAELAVMLERETLIAESTGSEPTVYVFGPEVLREPLRKQPGIKIHQLDALGYLALVDGDTRFSMALA
jgi:hypothetical protein